MNGSNFSIFKNESKSKGINIQENSSEKSIELYHNSDSNDNENIIFNEYLNENVLLKDKPILNLNTLQSIRISHSIENSKNSQSLIDILNENKIINLNNEIEENNENDVNINNTAKKNIKTKTKKNKNEEYAISRNLNDSNKKENNTMNMNNKKNNDIYDKFKIGDIFKERFEEKTKFNKLIYNFKDNKINKNKNVLNNQENKPKTLEYQNYIKNNHDKIKYCSSIKKNIHNEITKLKGNDSGLIEPDSIEMNNSKNNKIILETFNLENSSEKEDKNIMVSELDIDVPDSMSKNQNDNNEIKIKNMKLVNAVGYGNKKNIFGANKNIQTKMNEKNKLVKKKIYPIRKINLNVNIHKKNPIQLKKRNENNERINNTNNNINKYKSIHSSSSTKFSKRKIPNNLDLKQALSNSNIFSYNNHIMNTSTNLNKNSINKKSAYTISRKFSYKPKYSSKSIRNEKGFNLKKYYRINSVNKNKKDNDLYNNIKNIIMNSINRNNLNRALNITTLNSNSDLNNINNTNSFKKNNSFIINRKNSLNNINNKTKKKTDISNISNIPNNYYKKISSKNKIPNRKNSLMIKQKNKLYSNNNKIRNKINSIHNSIFRSNSYHEKKERNDIDNIYNKNYYDLNINNHIGNLYKSKDSNKIIINTVYNSYTNNIYPIPHKDNYSRYKKNIGYNNNVTYNYLENPFILLNHPKTNEINKKKEFLYDKKIINSNFSNKSKDNSNLLTEYDLNYNNKTLNNCSYNRNNSYKNNCKNIINDKARNKNYIRNFSNNLLKLNPFMTKNNSNKNKYILTNNSLKNRYGININKNYSFRSSINLTKHSKNIIQ